MGRGRTQSIWVRKWIKACCRCEFGSGKMISDIGGSFMIDPVTDRAVSGLWREG